MATKYAERIIAERRFYTGMAIGMIVIVLIGFASSFYLRGIVRYPRPNPTLPPFVLFHAATFTAWILLFVAQVRFIAAGRRDLHIKFGSAGLFLAVALIPLMYMIAVEQVGRANQPPFISPLGWMIIPISAIPVYTVLLIQGIRHRHSAQAHKRFMLGAALVMMDPAIARFPILPPFLISYAILGVLAWMVYLPMIWWDRRTIGRVHGATRLAVALFGMTLVARTAVLAAPATWEQIAAYFPGVS